MVGGAVPLRDDGLEEAEERDRRDDPNDRRGAPQRAEDRLLERERHRAGRQHRDDERGKCRPTPIAHQVDEREVRRERPDGALREVDQTGAAVDEHRTLREQRVRCTRAEPDDQELQERLHRSVDQHGPPKGESHSVLSKLMFESATKLPSNPPVFASGSHP